MGAKISEIVDPNRIRNHVGRSGATGVSIVANNRKKTEPRTDQRGRTPSHIGPTANSDCVSFYVR